MRPLSTEVVGLNLIPALSEKDFTVGLWFYWGTPTSSTIKNDFPDTSEIILKGCKTTFKKKLFQWNQEKFNSVIHNNSDDQLSYRKSNRLTEDVLEIFRFLP